MLRRIIFILFLICFTSTNLSMEAKENTVLHRPARKKKHRLSVCSVFKNEAKYLKEWIEYHRIVGVDHFYLYNNGSLDDFRETLHPYIKNGIVTLINWPDRLNASVLENEENTFLWSLSTQVPAYENAAKFRTIKETKWLVFLDIDEFLISSDANKLHEILERYDDYPGVVLTSEFFDSSNLDVVPQRKLLIEATELTQAPRKNIQKEVTKTIFKPALCKGFTWPPYQIIFQNDKTPIKLKRGELRINHYLNRYKGTLFFGKRRDKLHIDNRTLSEEETSELLNEGYEIDDQERSIQRFIPKLLRRLGL